jgi:hypothetical protein
LAQKVHVGAGGRRGEEAINSSFQQIFGGPFSVFAVLLRLKT